MEELIRKQEDLIIMLKKELEDKDSIINTDKELLNNRENIIKNYEAQINLLANFLEREVCG